MNKIFLACMIAFPLFFAGCAAGGGSPQQSMAMERSDVYYGTYKAYMDAEKKYLNLLFNIERMPDEEELWSMKRDQMLELMQLKELMLASRVELDNAIQEWEKYLVETKAEVKKEQVKQYNPNFTGRDGLRTSPGQLLPDEFRSSKNND